MKSIFSMWKQLPPSIAGPPPAPPAGYAGCFVRYSQEVEFFMYGGVVTLMTATQSESRADPDRKLERLVVGTAPTPPVSPPWLG